MCISQIQVSLSLSCILPPGSSHLTMFPPTCPLRIQEKRAKHGQKTTASLHPFEAPPPHPSSCSGVPVNSQQTPSGPSAGSPDRSTPQSLPAPAMRHESRALLWSNSWKIIATMKMCSSKEFTTCNMTSLRHHPITESHGIQWFQCYTVFSRVCWACRRWKIWSVGTERSDVLGTAVAAWAASVPKVSIFFSSSWLMGKNINIYFNEKRLWHIWIL